jgi:limonene 1,2-monooxygenase
MLGIDPITQRNRMEESLDTIIQLLTSEEPVSVTTDWFTLNEARLHLKPYTRPHFPIAVASTISPAGMGLAGKHGAGVLSIGSFLPNGLIELPQQWAVYEKAAAEHGQPIDRRKWRLLVPFYLAEDREQAFAEAREGWYAWTHDYFEETLGRPLILPGDDPFKAMTETGGAIVGTPDDAVAALKRVQELSGGFGGLLGLAHEWASREKVMHSYELFARYVMPHFQDSISSITASREWVSENRTTIFGSMPKVMEKAFSDAGMKAPDLILQGSAPVHPADPGLHAKQ